MKVEDGVLRDSELLECFRRNSRSRGVVEDWRIVNQPGLSEVTTLI